MATATTAVVVGEQWLPEHREVEWQGLLPVSGIPPIERGGPGTADDRKRSLAAVAVVGRCEKEMRMEKKQRGYFVGGEHFPLRVPGHGYFTRRGGGEVTFVDEEVQKGIRLNVGTIFDGCPSIDHE